MIIPSYFDRAKLGVYFCLIMIETNIQLMVKDMCTY